jgi:hypothetical protein
MTITNCSYSGFSATILFLLSLTCTGQIWTEQDQLFSEHPNNDDYFGQYNEAEGDFLLTSSFWDDDDENGLNPQTYAGAVYAYQKDLSGDYLFTQKIVSPHRVSGGLFGLRIDMDGDRAVVSTREGTDENNANWIEQAGAVHIYERDAGGTWVWQQKLVAPDRMEDDWFGQSVAIHGDYLAVGAPHHTLDENGMNPLTQAGAAYIFHYNGSSWDFVQKVTAFTRFTGDFFSNSIEVYGDILAVGSDWYGNVAGAVFTFKRDTFGVYQQQQLVQPTTIQDGDYFGGGITIDGDLMISTRLERIMMRMR